MNYYNDNDPFACQWLKNLIAAGELPLGIVDGRSITEVLPNGLEAFTQCHFFAGTGGWPLALRWAGWPDSRPVWTGSCPCQPLSCAGKRRGEKDKRHLWPEFYRLISECRPSVIFGEQTASTDGREWLDGISLDLEELGYAVGTADLCAAGTGAPHIRQRLFWVADAEDTNRRGVLNSQKCEAHAQARGRSGLGGVADTGELQLRGVACAGQQSTVQQDDGVSGRVADADGRRESSLIGVHGGEGVGAAGTGGLGNADEPRRNGRGNDGRTRSEAIEPVSSEGGKTNRLGDTSGGESPQSQEQPTRQKLATIAGTSWHYIHCADDKIRRVPNLESGILPLAHGIPRKLGPPLTGMGQVGIRAARANRVGRLRGYGNAIVPQLAVEFVRAFLLTTEPEGE